MAEIDELFDVKNNFLLGNYQGCINAANKVAPKSDAVKLERNVYIYRAYVAQCNYQLVLDEISNDAPAPLQAVRLLATYMSNPEQNKDIVLASLKEWMADGMVANNATLQLLAGMIYYNEGDFENALRCVRSASTCEGLSLLVQTYLRMDRLDLAEKELKTMQQIDEDANITLLASAWVNVALGGESINDALSAYQELQDRFQPTPLILNGLACCKMHLKKWEEAEEHLLEALNKGDKNTDTLVNLIVTCQHLKKPQEVVNRYLAQLRTLSPPHAWLLGLNATSDNFDLNKERHAI